MAETTYNDVLSVGMCPKIRPVGVSKKGKKGQKLSCVKLAICPDHPRGRRPLKFYMRGHVREVVSLVNGRGRFSTPTAPRPLDRFS